jgi:hypothetical protein
MYKWTNTGWTQLSGDMIWYFSHMYKWTNTGWTQLSGDMIWHFSHMYKWTSTGLCFFHLSGLREGC